MRFCFLACVVHTFPIVRLGKRHAAKRESVLDMESEDEPLGLTAMLVTPALVAASIFVLHLLPSEVWTFLTVWILASFPIGVLVGHCALGEE
jgi:hypothetical protein